MFSLSSSRPPSKFQSPSQPQLKSYSPSQGSSQGSSQDPSQGSSQGSPQGSSQDSPQGSSQGSPQGSSQPQPSPHLNSFYHKIYHKEYLSSEKVPLVFLHGLMGSSANWQSLVKHFPHHPLLVYDQRGHGRSFKPKVGNYRVEDYAQDLALILEELQWPKVIPVGHSMGGRNAMHFAYRFPQYVEKLVVEDMVPGAGLPIGKLLESIPTPFPHREAAKAFLLGPFLEKQRDDLGESSRKLALFLLANLRHQRSKKMKDIKSKSVEGVVKKAIEGGKELEKMKKSGHRARNG